MSEVSINVEVPQTYGLNITDATSIVGVAPGGSTTVSMTINNLGNGDDSFTYTVVNNWKVGPSLQ